MAVAVGAVLALTIILVITNYVVGNLMNNDLQFLVVVDIIWAICFGMYLIRNRYRSGEEYLLVSLLIWAVTIMVMFIFAKAAAWI